MTNDTTANPFRPGAGEVPPHFAGREEALGLFRGRVSQLHRDGDEGRSGIIIMQGPRGNGKTILLNRFKEIAKEAQRKDSGDRNHLFPLEVSVRSVPRGGIEAAVLLAPLIDPRLNEEGRKSDQMEHVTGKAGASILGIGVEAEASVERGQVDLDGGSYLSQALANVSRDRPTVLLVDEAHAMDVNELSVLLNAIEEANLVNSGSRCAWARVGGAVRNAPSSIPGARGRLVLGAL